jgi:bacteriorhodopsin
VGSPVKFNTSYYVIMAINAVCHLYVFISFVVKKFKERKTSPQQQQQVFSLVCTYNHACG